VCGIFGITLANRSVHNAGALLNDLKILYRSAMMRGQDATGLAINDGQSIKILRRDCKPTNMINEPIFENLVQSSFQDPEQGPLTVMGHSRLVTNGSLAIAENNQPIATNHIVGVHNGIVTNANSFPIPSNATNTSSSEPNSGFSAEGGLSQSDTQQLLQYLDQVFVETKCLKSSMKTVFTKIEGTASVALMTNGEVGFSLFTNNGSLYFIFDQALGAFVFASEYIFLTDLMKKSQLFNNGTEIKPKHLKANTSLFVTTNPLSVDKEMITDPIKIPLELQENQKKIPFVFIKNSVDELKRCTRCILPISYPGIIFDSDDVCNFCSDHVHQSEHGAKALEQLLDKYRRNNGDYDCLVGLSGGRDSSYGIYLLKTKYGMNPLAYTYDWGLTTDPSRRNQAKICGQLGIEQIIRSPDIFKKRRHIRKNISSWLRQPEMGMVPLFMAGDKDFYHYGRELRKRYNIDLTIMCSGSLLEQRQFFAGFCGVRETVTNTARAYDFPIRVKARMAFYYVTQYLKNPSYINESFYDSIRSFLVSFVAKDDFLYLYEYLPWNEKEIEIVLKREFDWEADRRYGTNQWRMGDGQTAFTNYIFHTVAGFSEFDNFRANQIREKLITREEAMRLIIEDNQPKWGALQYFAYVVGINLDEVLARINNIPKLY